MIQDDVTQISDGTYRWAAERLGIDEATIRAFAEVESGPYGAFDNLGRPTILFERHIFRLNTLGRFKGAIAPCDLSRGGVSLSFPSKWSLLSSAKPGGYGPQRIQYLKLKAASLLDRDAAILSTSWGLFQILGENYKEAGYRTLGGFLEAMKTSAGEQLMAFINFVATYKDGRILDHLREHQWTKAIALYNGPAHEKHSYVGRFIKARNKWLKQLGAGL